MSDPYQIRIAHDTDATMSAWEIPDAVREAMNHRLREQLAADPIQHLIRAMAPWGEALNLFAFSLPDPFHAARTHMFQFHVHYGQDEKTLHIVDVGHQLKDRNPPDLGPSLESNE